MREGEFLDAIDKMLPRLGTKFHNLLWNAGVKRDIQSVKKDLVALTILEALRNSNNPLHKSQTCLQLLKTKACNVWSDHYKLLRSSFNHAEHKDLELQWDNEQDPYRVIDAKSELQWIHSQSNPIQSRIVQLKLDGYNYREIAQLLHTTPGAITMQIQRLKEKLKSSTQH